MEKIFFFGSPFWKNTLQKSSLVIFFIESIKSNNFIKIINI